MSAYNKNIIKPFMLKYKTQKFPIDALGLTPLHEAALYRFIKHRHPNGDINHVTYKQILDEPGIGNTIARSISKALIGRGVEITDVPEEPTKTEPTRLVNLDSRWPMCSNCKAIFLSNTDAEDRLFNFCPMCGRKFKW